MAQYDEVCSNCDEGVIPDGRGDVRICDQCEGYGYRLTPKGVDLVRFLKRRGFNQSMSPRAEEELRGVIE